MFVPASGGADIVAPDIATILGRHANDRTELMDILWEIQHGYGYIPPEAAQQAAGWLGLTAGDVLETATFYHFFHTTPSGRYRIYLADTAIAKMRGYQQVYEALERETGAKFDGPASPDFGLFETACVGLSDQEPAMLVDDVVFTDLTPTSVGDIISQMKQGRSPAEIANPSGLPRSEVAYVDALTHTTVHTSGPTFFSNEADYRLSVDRCLAMRPEDVIMTIADSDLRGLGGAGFSTGMKWRLCREAAGDEKYVICNADEGEPGTFKDRVLLTRSPKQVFAGMIIAGHAIGAARGIVYLRAEYVYLRDYLEQQLAELRDEGLLGDGFDLRIQMGAGAYICGDESALIESCEGKRGTPRLKPPFPVEYGFLGKPTCVNNVETFAAVTRIMEMGADWFAAMGITGSTGTRLLSVSGDCVRPGIHEIEWGVTLREVLEMVGARDPLAVQISGPSGEMVSADTDADRKLAYDDISCNGSFMVFNTQRDLLSVVRDFMQFFVEESCGICVPCRAGNVLLRDKVDLVTAGRADQSDLDDMVRWGGIIARTSRCGLGATSPNPILTTLQKFPEVYSDRLRHQPDSLLASFDVDTALAGYPKALANLAEKESR
jgi:[NiFe] hydrogenase diaphorase moiety large subunit